VFYLQSAMYMKLLSVCLTGEVRYTFCLVKKIFILIEELLTDFYQYSPVGNYWHVLMYGSLLCIVCMVYYSIEFLTVGLEYH